MTKQSDAIKTAAVNTLPEGTLRPAMWAAKVFKDTSVSLIKEMGTMQDRVTEWAVQALMHLEAHKDVATLNKFIVAMPKGFRRNAMASWFLAYGCVKVNQDKGTARLSPLSYDKMKECKVEAGMADPWFEHLPEKAIDEVFDLQRAIHMLLQRAKGKPILVHGKPLDTQVANDMLKAMGAMVGEVYEPVPTAAEPEMMGPPAPEAATAPPSEPAKVVKPAKGKPVMA